MKRKERKIDFSFVWRHKYKKNKQICELLCLGNLAFCSFHLWVF